MRRKRLLFALGFVCAAGLLVLCLIAVFRLVRPGEIKLLTRELSLGKRDPGMIGETFAASPDSKRVAYVAPHGDKRLVVVDGVEGKEYDDWAAAVFSPDSKRLAYAAQRGDKWLVVVDGVEGKECDGIGARGVIFSPESKRVAYGAKRGGKLLVVMDGAEGKEYDGIANLAFSPGGKRVAYAAVRADRWFVVVDGVEGKEYDGFLEGSRLVFDSPKQFHTLARRGDEILRVEAEIVTPWLNL